ncbi:MAG: lipid IV(A) 3-deoxy-D-manno-octulosonic acid transferase [Sulfuricella sp.]|nr:lipid IV(A) 3-deoxy-D-manno-octulosonic acid transferase [Sulfuricella sp.]
MRRLYTLLLYLLLPYALFHLAWRGRKQPSYLQHIGERFGFYGKRPRQPLIWLHTVSVGETRAAASLVNALLERYPDHRILLTHMTPTGREAGEALYGERVLRCYLPYDFPWAVRRFLRHFKPAVGLLMETEIWFNLIGECRTAKVPLLLINARLSEKSRKKFAKAPALTREALSGLAAIAAQTRADAGRFKKLGAPSVEIMGNLKFDITPPEKMVKRGKALRIDFGTTRPAFLAASTREGEEALLLDALPQFTTPNLLFVIVPRHPQRFNEVAQLLEARRISFQRRSENRPIPPHIKVVLGDNMGELFAYYAACDLAYIGGSLLPLGGQNLIEAASVGTPILIGPHTFNFSEASELAIQAGAALRVQDAAELAKTATRLLADPSSLSAMSQAGRAFSQHHRGATARLMALISTYLV